MIVDILTEDEGWNLLPEREAVARRAVDVALTLARPETHESEIAIVFAGDARVAALNLQWRGKDRPTNVLSFPSVLPPAAFSEATRQLGDVVLARGVVTAEAEAAGWPLASHVSHLIVHGVLHLLGYSHDDDRSAEAMRAVETAAQRRLGYPDPYAVDTARQEAPR